MAALAPTLGVGWKASKPGPRMDALEKINRDNQIVVARMRGIGACDGERDGPVLREFGVPFEARRALLDALSTRKNGVGSSSPAEVRPDDYRGAAIGG
jgi:hypothetical protein